MIVDYHTHPLGHLDNYNEITDELIRNYLNAALSKGLTEIGFTDHDCYYEKFDFELIKKVAGDFPDLKVRKGIEMDYAPDKKEETKAFLRQFDLDYVIGSVHYLGDWVFDSSKYRDEFNNRNIKATYEEYFKLVEEAALSGLFDIIGHMDLIKIFNYRPEGDVLEIIIPVLEVIAEEDIVIEVNTNGLNKPVGEIYPSWEILEKAYQLGIKVTMSSDAHTAERVGENLDKVREMLLEIGYREIATFEKRKRTMVSLV